MKRFSKYRISTLAIALVLVAAGVGRAVANFVDDNTALPGPKTDRIPVTNPTQQWSAADANAVFNALNDLRTVAKRGTVNIKAYGAVGNGSTNDRAAIQAAINANPGKTIYFPKGNYLVDATITISARFTHLVGDFGGRASDGGSEIQCVGTGNCIQIGTDNGHAWDVGDYDGPQDHLIENLWIRHGAPDTQLASIGLPCGVGLHYKAGAYGVWDWRGGGIVMRNVGLEHFEANFVGIQSDLNAFWYVQSNYSKYGLYFGPRSDQNRVYFATSIFCDRAITIDRAGQTEIMNGSFVFCGTDTSSHIEVRRGSHGVLLSGNWHENSAATACFGFQGGMQSFVSVGEVDGYGAGGSIQSPGAGTSTAVAGTTLDYPHLYNLPPGSGHTLYLASVGKVNQFTLRRPSEYINSGLSSFDALVAIQSGQVPTTTDTQVAVYDMPDTMTRTQIFQNLGGGAVTAAIQSGKVHDSVTLGLDTTATHTFRGTIVQDAPERGTAFTTNNTKTGQTVGSVVWKLNTTGSSFDTTAGALFPVALSITDAATRSAGANSVGKTGFSVDVLNGQSNTAITTVRGDNRFNTTSGITEFANAVYYSNEIAPTSLSADQTDYSPTGLASASLILVTSSVAVNINSLALNANSAGGRDLVIRNDNASGGSNVTLKDEAAALGTASMRFAGRAHADTVLTPGTSARLRYSILKTRILVIGDTL